MSFRPKPPRVLSTPTIDEAAFQAMATRTTSLLLDLLAYFGVKIQAPVVYSSATHEVIIRERPVVVVGPDGVPRQVNRQNGTAPAPEPANAPAEPEPSEPTPPPSPS